jgi:hypothetical protein
MPKEGPPWTLGGRSQATVLAPSPAAPLAVLAVAAQDAVVVVAAAQVAA